MFTYFFDVAPKYRGFCWYFVFISPKRTLNYFALSWHVFFHGAFIHFIFGTSTEYGHLVNGSKNNRHFAEAKCAFFFWAQLLLQP